MSDPITFEVATSRFAFPLLFSGQAQKEVFINEALSRIDGLIHCAIAGQTAAPPASPTDGAAWLVAPNANAEWAGHEGHIALRQNGRWDFVVPYDGLRVVNISNGQDMRFFSGNWRAPVTPSAPVGGSTIDVEARSMLSALVTALQQAGIFSA